MIKIALSILISLTVSFSAAQTVRSPVAASYTRLGAYTLKASDVFSFAANQASLANTTVTTIGIYGERRFLLQELAFYQVVAALPTSTGNFGISGSYFGSAQNNEGQVGLAYGRKLGSRFSVGAQFNYYTVQVAGYGSSSAINFEAGFLIHVNEQLHAGFHVYNPTGSQLSKGEEERLPAIYNVGIGYEPSEHFFVSAEIEKTEDSAIGVTGGAQYTVDKKLLARVGFTSATASYYLGVGVVLKNLRLDATASLHPQIGITPGLMLIFNRPQK